MLIKNGKVVIFENNNVVVKEADIKIEKEKIVKIATNIEPEENEYVINAINKAVMPGLINTHAHIPMSIFRGTFEDVNLYTWLNEKIWPVEAKLTKEQIYKASLISYIEMIRTGTTCVNDHYFVSEEIRKAANKSKVRTVLTRVLMDNGDEEESEKRIKEFEELYNSRDINNTLITYTVSPHGLYTCSDRVLEKSRDLALKYNLPVHVHFLESIDEIQDIKNMHNINPGEVLKKYFNGIHLILAHGVKLSQDDIEILKDMDCGIAHNPVSNLRLGCKIADVTKYLEYGINVAIGTDGQGSGNNLDMFEAMRLACLLQGGIHENENRINSRDAIKMATINGAKLLGLENKIGSIEEGKNADIILVDISKKIDNITMLPNNDVISNLVYNTSGINVDTTIVDGEILMENGKLKDISIWKETKEFIEEVEKGLVNS